MLKCFHIHFLVLTNTLLFCVLIITYLKKKYRSYSIKKVNGLPKTTAPINRKHLFYL